MLNDPELSEDVKAVIEFSWLTGWRALDEVTYITWEQVDLKRGEIRWPIGSTKNKKGRPRASDPNAESGTIDAALRGPPALLEGTGHGVPEQAVRYVFHRNGRRVAKKRWYAEWHAACDRHEIKDLRSPNVGQRSRYQPTDDSMVRTLGPVRYRLEREA